MSTMGNTRYSKARAGATPEFTALCKTLYGDVIDADQVWDDVVKSSPDQADTSTHSGASRQAMRAIGLTGGVLGGGLGLATGREALRERSVAQQAGKATKWITRNARGKRTLGTKGKLALSGTLAVTDSTEIGALGRDTWDNRSKHGELKPTKVTASKGLFNLPKGVLASARGLQGNWNKAAQGVSAAIKSPKVEAAATKAATNVGTFARTNKVPLIEGTAGGIAVGGTSAALTRRNNGGNNNGSLAKSDVTWEGTFSKLDTDQHLAFGWASVVKINGSPVLDKQGDIIEPEEIEKAAYSYVMKSRIGGDMHRRAAFGDALHKADGPHKVSDMVESMVFTDDKIAKMGLPDEFPRGWWVGFKVHDENVWSEGRKGNRTGFSIHGKGIRKDQSVDEIMGYV